MVDSVLYFSSPNAKLKISLRESDYVCCESAELLEFLKSYDSGETLFQEPHGAYRADTPGKFRGMRRAACCLT